MHAPLRADRANPAASRSRVDLFLTRKYVLLTIRLSSMMYARFDLTGSSLLLQVLEMSDKRSQDGMA